MTIQIHIVVYEERRLTASLDQLGWSESTIAVTIKHFQKPHLHGVKNHGDILIAIPIIVANRHMGGSGCRLIGFGYLERAVTNTQENDHFVEAQCYCEVIYFIVVEITRCYRNWQTPDFHIGL